MDNNFIDLLLTQKALPSPVKCFGEPNIETISKAICAYLNAQGGWIIVGVDDNHNPTNINEVIVMEQIQCEVTNNIAPLPLVYIQKETYRKQGTILITVIKGSIPPYSFKGKYYIAIDDEVKIPSSDQISYLLRSSFSIKSTWESIVNLLANPNLFDRKLMEDVYQEGLLSHKLVESPDGLTATLSELKLIDSYEVKNGAVCLFGDNISQTLPQSRVRIQLMSKGKSAEKFDNTLILEGNIFVLLKEVMNYFKNILPRQSVFVENQAKREDNFLYPLDVLREAIGNSLIHRDYTDSIGEISIFIYSNKIEIRNPGRLPKDIVKGKSEVLPHGSVLRNPLMAEIFYIGGYMEKTGRGMELISRKMKELGKKLPEWTSSNEQTILTIYNEINKTSYNERIRSFMESHVSNVIFTKKEYIEFFDKKPSKITAQSDISKMMELGICEKIGKGPATKYKIIDRY